MGRATTGEPTLPRGISIRELKGERRIQIAFSYQGEQCRELLPPGKLNKTYVDYAESLRGEIRRKIADGTFNYRAYFPDSPAASRFEPVAMFVLMGDLLRKQTALYEKQAENDALSASTLLGYVKIIKRVHIPKFGTTGVADLSPSMLREWIASLGVTGKTVRNYLTPLRSVLDDAVNDELIQFNPLDRIALNKLIKQTAKKSDYEVDPFDMDEVGALIKHARSDERPFIQFWLQTGLRPGEMLALSWPSIDWVHGCARIEDNIVTGMQDGKIGQVSKKPKTDAGKRDVELSDLARQALNAQKTQSFLEGGRIWHDPRKGGPWETESQVRKTLWAPLCKRAGVRYRNPYQMRHTYASTLLTGGCNPFWLANQMGHVDAEMVFKIYGKWIPKNYQKGAQFTRISHEVESPPAKAIASD